MGSDWAQQMELKLTTMTNVKLWWIVLTTAEFETNRDLGLESWGRAEKNFESRYLKNYESVDVLTWIFGLYFLLPEIGFRLFRTPNPLLSPQNCTTRCSTFSLFRRLENQPLKACSSSSARRVDIFRGVEHQNRTIFSRDTTFTIVRDIRVHLNIQFNIYLMMYSWVSVVIM